MWPSSPAASGGIGRAIAEMLAERRGGRRRVSREREAPARELEAAVQRRRRARLGGPVRRRRRGVGRRVFRQACPERSGRSTSSSTMPASPATRTSCSSTRRGGTRCSTSTSTARITACARSCAACCCGGGAASSTCRRRARGCRLPGRRATRRRRPGSKGLTRALSRDLAAKGVLVNAVSPGLIETEMLDAMPAEARAGASEGRRDRPRGHAARGRRGGGVSRVRRRELHHGTGDRRRRRPAVNMRGHSDDAAS